MRYCNLSDCASFKAKFSNATIAKMIHLQGCNVISCQSELDNRQIYE